MKFLCLLVFLQTLLCAMGTPLRADDYPPLAPDDLKMTFESMASGAPAIILYRQVDRDDREEVHA